MAVDATALTGITVDQALVAQQSALMRVQLFTIGETHQILNDFTTRLQGEITAAAGGEAEAEKKPLGGMELLQVVDWLDAHWPPTFARWHRLMQAMRMEAARISHGSLVIMHEHFIGEPARQGLKRPEQPAPGQVRASRRAQLQRMHEQQSQTVGVGVAALYAQRMQLIMDAASARLWGTGFNLSQRIWQMDAVSLENLKRVVYSGVANGTSAWDLAQQVPTFLGAGADCPRWTQDRLYSLTKGDIAKGNKAGLISSPNCAGQGVSYNALRLARTEIQWAHALATTMMLDQVPWVELVTVNRAPTEVDCEICDPVVEESPYPKAEVPALPLHPNCLCYVTAELPSFDAFVDDLSAWVAGDMAWPAMDAYARWTGLDTSSPAGLSMPDTTISTLGGAMAAWLWTEPADLVDDYLDDYELWAPLVA